MEHIFERLNNILDFLNESTTAIPINPDMTTTEQGKIKAYEKIAKYFYELSFDGNSMGGGIQSKDDIDLPDDFINPKVKGKLDGMKDKEFERNKVIWDQDDYDKLDKDVTANGDSSDDEFDDFDYRNNEFGDDEDDDTENDENDESGSSGSSGSSGGKSESDRLENEINNAIDKLKDNKNSDDSNSNNQSSGQSNKSDENGDGDGEESSGQQGQSNNSQNGKSRRSNGQSNDETTDEPNNQSGGGQSNGGNITKKDEKLKQLKDALKNGDKQSFDENIEDLKKGESGEGKLAGESKQKVDDNAFENDMRNAGFSDGDINEMENIKNTDTAKDYNETELEKLKQEVIDGLEDKCKSRGGSALATTIVRSTMKKKIENQEWKKMLELFLKSKSVMKGDTSKSRNRITWGHKNHLWRNAVLPTYSNGLGEIQKIYCFVDFSGSVNQDLVYTFLGRVIDLCQKLSYTDVVVYGFSDYLSVPRKINRKMMKTQGIDVVLSQTWDFIDSQHLGSCEQFLNVANEMMSIWRKDKDSVFLIFGDGFWSTQKYLKNCPKKILDNVCVLMYYINNQDKQSLSSMTAELVNLIGVKSIITTKAESIMVEKKQN